MPTPGGFRVEGSGCRVEGLGLRAQNPAWLSPIRWEF